MGLSSLPSPSEGVFTVLLVNTALSIAIFKELIRSILHIIGLRSLTTSSSGEIPLGIYDYHPVEEEARFRILPPIRFHSVPGLPVNHDCRVCLNRFEPESEISQLSCGHLFHKVCLDQWLDYWHVTCPLCRRPLTMSDATPISCPSF